MCFKLTFYASSADMTVNATAWCSSRRLPGFRHVSNHRFICLMTSKLIYRVVIYRAKNESLIVGFLSVVTVENVSGDPPGGNGPQEAMYLLGMICHHPSELMISMCWSHSLRWCGFCDGASFPQQNTMCHRRIHLYKTYKAFI